MNAGGNEQAGSAVGVSIGGHEGGMERVGLALVRWPSPHPGTDGARPGCARTTENPGCSRKPELVRRCVVSIPADTTGGGPSALLPAWRSGESGHPRPRLAGRRGWALSPIVLVDRLAHPGCSQGRAECVLRRSRPDVGAQETRAPSALGVLPPSASLRAQRSSWTPQPAERLRPALSRRAAG